MKIRFSRSIKLNPDVYEFRNKWTKIWGSNINVTQIMILTAHHHSFVFILNVNLFPRLFVCCALKNERTWLLNNLFWYFLTNKLSHEMKRLESKDLVWSKTTFFTSKWFVLNFRWLETLNIFSTIRQPYTAYE